MTDITPIVATGVTVQIGGVAIDGIANVKFVDKNTMKDITKLGDTAKKNFPTIQEWQLSFDFVAILKSDAGQVALRAAKSAKTKPAFIVTFESGFYYTCEGGYVESLDFNAAGADDIIKGSCSISQYGTAILTTS